MSSPIRIAPDFDVQYPTASATATECAMNLVFTADLLQKRIATLLQPLHLTPTSGLVLSILANAELPLPPNEIADRLIISRATVTGLPWRVTVIECWLPSLASAARRSASVNCAAGLLSSAVTTSPFWQPSFSACEPSRTAATVYVCRSAPDASTERQ